MMRKIDKVLEAMAECSKDDSACLSCPYYGVYHCWKRLCRDAFERFSKMRDIMDEVDEDGGSMLHPYERGQTAKYG